MAIEKSHLSMPEHQDKIDPLVGTIITTNEGVVLGRAYRGKLREGDH